jgi:hypothetical protein
MFFLVVRAVWKRVESIGVIWQNEANDPFLLRQCRVAFDHRDQEEEVKRKNKAIPVGLADAIRKVLREWRDERAARKRGKFPFCKFFFGSAR